jgi:peptide chain release factor 3
LSEYGVDADYEPADYAAARWITCADREKLAIFEKQHRNNLALDSEGNLIYLAMSEWRLSNTMEEWPDISMHKTMEHSQRLS